MMANLLENLPYSLNNEFRGYLVNNFKTLNKDRQYVTGLIDSHKNQDLKAHTSKQIDHNGKPLNETVDALAGRINNQIYGASKNSSAEVKDIRVGMDGIVHDLAQDRLMKDLTKIDDVATQADNMAQKHENQIGTSAYYNEIDYVSGRKHDSTYKLVYIPHRDSEGNLIKVRKGLAGDTNKLDYITAREFAKQTGATFVSNASTGSGSQLKLHGQQIYDGQIMDSIKEDEYEPIKKRWTLAVADDNTLTAFPQHITAQEIKDKGFNNTWSGFGPLIMEGKPVYKTGDYSENSEQKHPRTVIAQLPNKDILIFTCDGRVESEGLYNAGMTLPEVIDTLYDHYGDIEFAFNLDGGGSTTSVLRSRTLNKPTDNANKSERNLLDFIYVGKDPKQIRDKDIQKAYEDIGDVRASFQFLYGLIQHWNSFNTNELRLTQYDDYTGLVALDGEENPKKKFYMTKESFRFWDYDTARTWFKVTDDGMLLHNRQLADNYSAPKTVKDCNNLSRGGSYHVPKTAKGSPYPNASSAIVTQYNVTYADFDDAATAFQTAVPFARSNNYKMKRRTYAEGKWSQWFNV